ncbi:hypothetical protein KR51_00036580 [Rubidibacter lacunae KORDI 51-2]|uniref:Uncharacterized protein n=1 Tax=Rubidibacter lacunae KORDI 51-2 TaxID=582515 RepID=U5DJK9_9CHRO|nr:hypothetical protein KR51_00036580 [Rubidibacter lacunae KORDI 51-2]
MLRSELLTTVQFTIFEGIIYCTDLLSADRQAVILKHNRLRKSPTFFALLQP